MDRESGGRWPAPGRVRLSFNKRTARASTCVAQTERCDGQQPQAFDCDRATTGEARAVSPVDEAHQRRVDPSQPLHLADVRYGERSEPGLGGQHLPRQTRTSRAQVMLQCFKHVHANSRHQEQGQAYGAGSPTPVSAPCSHAPVLSAVDIPRAATEQVSTRLRAASLRRLPVSRRFDRRKRFSAALASVHAVSSW